MEPYIFWGGIVFYSSGSLNKSYFFHDEIEKFSLEFEFKFDNHLKRIHDKFTTSSAPSNSFYDPKIKAITSSPTFLAMRDS